MADARMGKITPVDLIEACARTLLYFEHRMERHERLSHDPLNHPMFVALTVDEIEDIARLLKVNKVHRVLQEQLTLHIKGVRDIIEGRGK